MFRTFQDLAVIDTRTSRDRTYPPTPDPQFAGTDGARWRRFLERIGTRSNDFESRLARARFVYLHRRETGTHWLPL